MQSKLFRFEIVRALHPTLFAARDLRTAAPVTVLEWTPPAAEREAARERFQALAAELPGELFSADASLYLALPAGDASHALTILRRAGLFTGSATELAPAPAAPPPAAASLPPNAVGPAPPLAAPFRAGASAALPVAPGPSASSAPVPPRRASTSPSGGVLLFGLSLVAAVALAVGWSLGHHDDPSQASNSTSVSRPSGSSAVVPAGSATDRKGLTALEASFAGVHLLRLRNGCGIPVRAAAIHTGFNGEQLAEGWISLRPGQTAVLAASPTRDFHVFAIAADGQRAWGSEAGLPVQTETGNFTYALSAPSDGTAERTAHGTFTVHVTGPADVSSLDCRSPAGAE